MKNKGKLFRRLISLALALAVLLPLTGQELVIDSSAVTQAEINALKGDASKLASQKKDIQAQLKAVQSDKNSAMTKKELLESQIDVIQQEIDNINAQIDMYDQLIVQKTGELAQAEADEAAQYDLFCRRIRYMEEQGETSYWSILFSSSNFSELLDNYMMIEEIIEYDNQVMDDLVALQERVKVEKNALEEAQAEQEAVKAEQQSAQKELKDQEAEVDKLISEIKSQEDQLEAMETELNKAAKELDAQIKAKEKEYAAQISQVKSESGFMWPLAASYNKLSSLYGNRKHPVTGKYGKHSGIDIPAPAGTPIYAAKSGVVITSEKGSGSYWSFGNYVLIAHSDGTSTLYAHMSKRGCSKGQTVKQGDTIGYVGTTGRSTGNHLHFEIRVNGSRVDPVNYFKDKALYIDGARIK
ncbi:peptidase M23 [Pseudoflavonifractor sp. 60]|uniref:murein hydrolase activator EnvC family protein n=1 Tax=Pseudoflavonifractor sp. 60 TaxID=2304576 RepID=UPI001370C1D8|nr:peptidoglycan DD-metalloendopeptidase family protein [Pseudoflavonifractor sp. 60]NBI68744.1 peptidase M23 [Pseudoflavonifractor sp. 60]